MPTNREKLLSLIQNRAFMRGEVKLSSGQKSDFYVDGKMIEMHPLGAYLIGEALFEQVEGMGVNAVGGLAIGAVPLVTSLAVSCHLHGRDDIEGFFVREEAKSHGTMKTIEGKLPEGARVVIVDDVVTSGNSVLKAVEAVEGKGATVVAIVAIVDRDAGAKEFFAAKGYRYESIFTKQDVLGYVHA
jgi:orotate phosphoribosyltransferase